MSRCPSRYSPFDLNIPSLMILQGDSGAYITSFSLMMLFPCVFFTMILTLLKRSEDCFPPFAVIIVLISPQTTFSILFQSLQIYQLDPESYIHEFLVSPSVSESVD